MHKFASIYLVKNRKILMNANELNYIRAKIRVLNLFFGKPCQS